MLIPLVSIAEFDAITCNRCGNCCERFFSPTPIEIAQAAGKLAVWRASDGYDPDHDRTWCAPEEEWWSHIAPHDGQPAPEAGQRLTYACDRFERDADGLGRCTAYERRPYACHGFPYGAPAANFPGCSWDVEILVD